MKNCISLLSLCLFFNVLVAQSSHHFLPVEVEKQWNVVSWEVFEPTAFTTVYQTGKDTLIFKGDQVYRYVQIEQTRDSSYTNWELRSLFREDTLQSRVYIYDEKNEKDFLLYDFNMQVGDTLIHDGFCVFQVTAIDSIEINGGQKRKRLLLKNEEYGFMYWIEGIGGSEGLFNRIQCYLDGPNTSLNCYYENDEKVYSTGSECFIVNTQEFPELQQISLFPNPTTDHLQLNLSEISIPNLQVHVFSMFGQAVKSIHATNGRIQQIEVNDLASGVYFLSLEKNGQLIWSERFVKKE